MFTKKLTLSLLLLLAVTSVGAAPTIAFESRLAFVQAASSQLHLENWTSYPPETLLEGKMIRGVTYDSTSAEQLVVGSPHGAGWVIGYSRGGGRYASFSFETITFTFSDPVTAFGIALSQGNSSGANSYSGKSEWEISIDSGAFVYTSTATYSQSDFTGEAYLGLVNLAPVSSFAVTRLSSDANIVWDVRDISWMSASAVSEPTSMLLLLAGVAPIALGSLRRRTET
ncbi:MAG: hypothetical protein IPM01_20775 [Burkholderiaceae bacterium]|nr:hypothetical protein [Burkholderiaceae bacterium]